MDSDKLEQEFYEIAKTATIRHTIQILLKRENGILKPCGSGVLFMIQDLYFILTAAHVTDQFQGEQELFVKTRDGYPAIDGEVLASNLDHDSLVDLAYIILSNGTAKLLEKYYAFLTIDGILKDHKPLQMSNYILLGYPIYNYNFDNNGNLITGASIFLVGGSLDEKYLAHGYSQDVHLCLDYSHIGSDIATRDSKLMETPTGISGCGIWFFYHVDDKIMYSLIGAVIEIQLNQPMVIVGNRIEILINKINLDYSLGLF